MGKPGALLLLFLTMLAVYTIGTLYPESRGIAGPLTILLMALVALSALAYRRQQRLPEQQRARARKQREARRQMEETQRALQRAKQARRQMEETQRELQRTKQARRTIRRR